MIGSLIKVSIMIYLTYNTPINILENIKIGDTVFDYFRTSGKVVRIERYEETRGLFFIFILETGAEIPLIAFPNPIYDV